MKERGDHEVLVGSCLDVLPGLPAGRFHACVTSPPYFALRDYGTGTWEGGDPGCEHDMVPSRGGRGGSGAPGKQTAGAFPAEVAASVCGKCGAERVDKQIGSEPSPEAFVAALVSVFREVRRVLRDDGVLWVNLGDSYASSGGRYDAGSSDGKTGRGPRGERRSENTGNQLLMPHRVALALQADGWILRQTIAWCKKSPMPESVNGTRFSRCRVKVAGQQRDKTTKTGGNVREMRISPPHPDNGIKTVGAQYIDCPGCPKCEANGGYVLRRGQGRCTTAFEYVFLFAKTNGYFWDMENCREPVSTSDAANSRYKYKPSAGSKESSNMDSNRMGDEYSGYFPQFRIPRNTWIISSEPNSFRHFATFPSELVRRMLAPLSPKGCCPQCGQQWAPVVDTERVATRPGTNSKLAGVDLYPKDHPYQTHKGDVCGNRDPERHTTQSNVLGYRPICDCKHFRLKDDVPEEIRLECERLGLA